MAKDQILEIAHKVQENIQALDKEQLSKKYHNRRTKFINMLDSSSHDEIKGRLLNAVVSTDICIEIHQDFLESLVNKTVSLTDELQKDLSQYKAVSETIIENFEALLKEVQEKSQKGISEFEEESIQLRRNLFEFAAKQKKQITDVSFISKAVLLYLTSINITINYNSLINLLTTNDLKLIGEVLVVALKSIIGIFPAGSVATLFWDLYEVSKKQSEQYKQASDLLTQLDNYSHTAYQWCVLTQALIEVNEERITLDIKTDDISNIAPTEDEIKNISKIVDSRFENFLRRFENVDSE